MILLPMAISATPAMAHHDNVQFMQFLQNVKTNLFKPLLLFFMVGLCIPLLKIHLEFPQSIYQGLTIYLLISIGWHGGEELAVLPPNELVHAGVFMLVGFLTNGIIGLIAYFLLRTFVPSFRKVDSAAVAAYYGSDSAGTFLTCMGTLQAAKIAFAPFMPVMLAIMEIPGCLVGLFIVSRLRKHGMDKDGFMPDELALKTTPKMAVVDAARDAVREEEILALEEPLAKNAVATSSWKSIAKEVLLNPGLFLLMSGILVGFVSRLQGASVVQDDDRLFVGLFQGILCLFLLEMGITAAKRMEDLRQADWRFIAFALLAPNLFACIGLAVCHAFSLATHQTMEQGTYVLFAVLCAAASYIAVPAVQRLAIPEASPTLPLAASLGCTFVYNVTIGIPLYMFLAQQLVSHSH
ncbi:MAG: sodium-dependent bicarbonate transport family permease [Candidatus Obscuribacterales bacterium]|nr:sodium-dependent bicarbonate transport family permease [Candidatus Obscuribacterales bacterium]